MTLLHKFPYNFKRLSSSLITIVFCSFCYSTLAIAAGENTYIVGFHQLSREQDDSDASVAQAVYEDLGVSVAEEHGAEMINAFGSIGMGTMMMTEEEAIALAADSRVDFVEKNKSIHKRAEQNNPDWGLDRIDQRDLPLNKKYNYNYDGSGITAYVIDTGVNKEHSDFGGRVTSGFNAIDNNTNTDDCDGHGTHVAGLVGSATYGVAKKVNIVAVKVLGCDGQGDLTSMVAGIDWVMKNAQKPAVANLSFGVDERSAALDQAVKKLVDANITSAIASGNNNDDACNFSPQTEKALLVASSTINDDRANSSNFGKCIDIFAPGEDRKSTWTGGTTETSIISGTSMASPTVAGAAVLVLEQNKSFTVEQVKATLISRASTGKLKNVEEGSPNKLLYTLPTGGEQPKPEPEPKPNPDPNPEPEQPNTRGGGVIELLSLLGLAGVALTRNRNRNRRKPSAFLR